MNFEKSIKLKSSLICSDCSKEELDRDLRDAQKAETNEGAKTTKHQRKQESGAFLSYSPPKVPHQMYGSMSAFKRKMIFPPLQVD